MADRDGTNREVLAAQAEMFRLAERDHGLTLKALALETGIPLSTLKSFCQSNIFARARIGLPDFVTLARVVPDDCLSIILEPAGKFVGSVDSDDGDMDALAREASGFVAEKLNAEEDGRICHIEKQRLRERARRLGARGHSAARRAAA